MEVEEVSSPWSSLLKRERDEEDPKDTKRGRNCDRSRAEKALVAIEIHSVPVSPAKHHTQDMARSLPSSPYRDPYSLSPSLNLLKKKSKKERKKLFLRGKNCVSLTCRPSRWKVHGRSPKFPEGSWSDYTHKKCWWWGMGVPGGDEKCILEHQNSTTEESPELKNISNFCSGTVPVLLHPSLYFYQFTYHQQNIFNISWKVVVLSFLFWP